MSLLCVRLAWLFGVAVLRIQTALGVSEVILFGFEVAGATMYARVIQKLGFACLRCSAMCGANVMNTAKA